MAKAWKDVIASQQYQALSPQQRAEAQEQYFNDVVAPQAGEAVNEAKQQFYTAYPVETVQQEQQPAPVPQQEAQQPEGFWANVKDMVTGDSRMTPEMEKLQSVSDAPELSEFNKDAAKVAWAQMMGNQQDQEIMLRNLGAEISYDAKGNAIVTMPEMVKQMGWLPKHHADKLAAEYGGVAEVDGDGNTVIKLPPRQYALNKPGLSPEDVASGAALAASYTPAGRAGGLVSAGLRAAGTDALIQGTTSYMGGTDIDPFQVGLSGVLGTGGKAFENIVGAAARAIKGKMSPEKEALIRTAEQNGVDVLTTDVIPPKGGFGKSYQQSGETSLMGTGQRRAAQEEQRKQLVSDSQQLLEREFGIYSPQDMQQEVSAGLKKAKKTHGKVIGEITEQMGDVVVPPARALNAIDDSINTIANGLKPDNEAIQVLTRLKDKLSSGINFGEWRQLKTDLRESLQGGNLAMPKQIDAVYANLNSAINADMNTAVRRSLGAESLNKLRVANNGYRSVARGVEKTGLKNAIEKGDVTPELIDNLIFSRRPSDVARVYGMVNDNGKNQIKSAYLGRAFEKADGSPDGMVKQIDNMIKQSGGGIYRTIFSPKEMKVIEGLRDVLKATERASAATKVTQTGMATIVPLREAAAIGTAGITLAIEAGKGTIARVYESKPIRNMLLRLAGTPKGSTAYDRLISQISQATTAVMQGEKSK
ncbi:hypothetical protein ACMFGU_09685 [Morganella morganii]|uniref:hypothetical protein n=1 Tax=Morganella morganii TaxID=582 RepID=UPI003CF655EB